MSEEEVLEICRRSGMMFPQDYMQPYWEPHAWVIEAILEAYDRGLYREIHHYSKEDRL